MTNLQEVCKFGVTFNKLKSILNKKTKLISIDFDYHGQQ